MKGITETIEAMEVGWTCRSCGCRISERNCKACHNYRKIAIIHGLEHVMCAQVVALGGGN